MEALERSSLDPLARDATGGIVASDTRHTAHARAGEARSERLPAIDRLRGLVMVLMALDHVRAYFSDVTFDALDLSQTNTALYFTRWVTHLCAPSFILLAGVSARLQAARMSPGRLSGFLLTRGLWLIVLEVTVVQFAWRFNWRYDGGLALQVIWAIGASMVVLAALVHLPLKVLAGLALVLIVGHNAFDGFTGESWGGLSVVWRLLHVQGRVPFGFIVYPLVPWVAIMALGYVLGGIYVRPSRRRRQVLFGVAALSLGAFGLLRFVNGYGDPQPWTPQASGWFTVLSFVDVHKYPPSLAYTLLMLGLACALLAVFERGQGRWLGWMTVFGRVPLFFYVMHLMLLHALAGLLALALGQGSHVMTHPFYQFGPPWGFSLPAVYVAWVVVVVALYPVCVWFGEFKRRKADQAWVSYV